ncbi:MAG: hypothetical protein GWO24_35665 [Akkermansiaceae bacterium]|nr:hypothetical protein [Akkermansiaceae bacterium]
MTRFLDLTGSVTAAIGISMMSISCDERGGSNIKDEANHKGNAAAATGDGTAKNLEDRMLGYWSPDTAAMTAAAREESGDDERARAMLPMILAMMSNLAVEVKKGEWTIHGVGEAETCTYRITKEDPAANMLTLEVGGKDGTGPGTATIDRDQLILERDGDELVLARITREEFTRRREAATGPGGLPGLPEGPVPPIPAPIPPAPNPPDR